MITNNLKQLMRDKNINQGELAEITGLSRQTINKYCRNRITRFDEPSLEVFCEYFEVSFNELLQIVPGKR